VRPAIEACIALPGARSAHLGRLAPRRSNAIAFVRASATAPRTASKIAASQPISARLSSTSSYRWRRGETGGLLKRGVPFGRVPFTDKPNSRRDAPGRELGVFNEKLRLSANEIAKLSPLKNLGARSPPMSLFVGADELPELKRQSEDYARAAQERRLPVSLTTLPGHHHFSVLDEFVHPVGALTNALVDMLSCFFP
jgi:hypothetical protein